MIRLVARTPRAAIFLLAAIPIAITARFACANHVDLPYFDQWQFVSTLGRVFDGAWEVDDFTRPHNSHRILFPRLVMVGLASLTHWNTGYEVAATLVAAGFSLLAPVYWVRRVLGPEHGPGVWWLVPAFSLLIFSQHGWVNWVVGWQFQIHLACAASAWALVLVSDARGGRGRATFAAALAVVATYSFACGLAVWPIGLLLLGLRGDAGRGEGFVAWISMGAIAIGTYLVGLGESGSVLPAPGVFLAYVARIVGLSISGPDEVRVSSIGAVGLLAFTGLSIASLADARSRRCALAFLGLGLFGIASAAMVALGRIQTGIESALSPRYATLSTWVWVASLGLLWIRVARTERGPERIGAGAVAACFVVGLLTYSVARQSTGFERAAEHRSLLLEARAVLISGGLPEPRVAARVFPSAFRPDPALDILRRHRLSLFRESPNP